MSQLIQLQSGEYLIGIDDSSIVRAGSTQTEVMTVVIESAWENPSILPMIIVNTEDWAWQNPSILPLIIKVLDDWAWKDIPPAPQWSLPENEPRREIFIAVLRADGFDDVEVPMSSMQLRRRDGEPTMVSCVVPDAEAYYDYAEDRKGGELIIMAGSVTEDGIRHLSELDRVTLEDVSYDIGVHSSSLSLAGYRTATTENPREVEVAGSRYYGLQADGKRRVRGKLNNFLRPGDTIIFGEESFIVEQIYIAVYAKDAYMEASGV